MGRDDWNTDDLELITGYSYYFDIQQISFRWQSKKQKVLRNFAFCLHLMQISGLTFEDGCHILGNCRPTQCKQCSPCTGKKKCITQLDGAKLIGSLEKVDIDKMVRLCKNPDSRPNFINTFIKGCNSYHYSLLTGLFTHDLYCIILHFTASTDSEPSLIWTSPRLSRSRHIFIIHCQLR